ncbi:MAG: putative Ig domain-containing protein, partial [Betaproteobacteria bacterium]|nr:putative Ig domain-containing protein [Betaproteobacteria bacterium]
MEPIERSATTATTIRSPIILDLDNDGIETTPVTAGTYFDHANDGFAERTGWVGADDGLLVRDLNNNGTIDSGQELFGSETLLASGPNAGTKAPNGFEALKELDQNKDGKLDSADAAFATLRIWQDTDGDGFTSAGELHTLTDKNIQSIQTAYTTGTTTDAHGNQHQQQGSYTTTTGQTRTATDVWFQADPTYSIATEWIDVSDDIAALPDATGYGHVRDLHQAMARDPGGRLQQLVTQYTQTSDAAQRDTILTDLIYHWTGVQNIDPKSRAARLIYGNVIGDARKLEALEEFLGQEWVGTWCWGTRDPNPHGRAAPVLLQAWDQLKELIGAQLMAQSHLKPMFDRITYTWDDTRQTLQGDLTQVAAWIGAQLTGDHTAGLQQTADFSRALRGMSALGSVDIQHFQQALLPLGEDVLGVFNSASAGLLPTENNDILSTKGSSNQYLRGLGGNDLLTTGDGNDTLDGGLGDDTLKGGQGDDLYLYTQGRDSVQDAGGTDILELREIQPDQITITRDAQHLYLTLPNGDRAKIADWFLSPAYRIERIRFGDGTERTADEIEALVSLTQAWSTDDQLYGSSVADSMNGYAGDDFLAGYQGDDTLDGGAGNDALQGGDGNDLYLFGSGDGQDTLTDGNGVDTLRFKDDVTPADILVRRNSHHVFLTHTGTGARLTLQNWYDANNNRVERIEFADGTTWDVAHVEILANQPTAKADYLGGSPNADTLEGQGGNDEIDGGAGDDQLDGGSGADVLLGGAGNDTLEGGTGDDTLEGGQGDDIYLFGRGSGQDSITENDSTLGNVDTIRLTEGLTPTDIQITRDPWDLYLRIRGTNDQITMKNWFTFDSARVERLEFADGVVWDAARLVQETLIPTEDSDVLLGFTGDDVIHGAGGDDHIEAGAGSDHIEGGVGADAINGGEGNDTYTFNLGDGADTLIDTGGYDVLRFGSGISATDVAWSRSGLNLELAHTNGTDKITIANWFSQDWWNTRFERIDFADGTAWHRGSFDGQVQTITGTNGADTLAASTGYDYIVTGLEGSDQITGGYGLDFFVGGAGNDRISGRGGSDTYFFNLGDGTDTIIEESGIGYQSPFDVLKFGPGIHPEDITAKRIGLDLELRHRNGSDKVILSGWYQTIDGQYKLERVDFTDGTQWSQAYLTDLGLHIDGTDGNDLLEGTKFNDTIQGMAGDDTLKGGRGDDFFHGGAGNDLLDDYGQEYGNYGGANTYLFNLGDGVDTIVEYGGASEVGDDTLRFGPGILASDIQVVREGVNLAFRHGNGQDKVIVLNVYSSDQAFTPLERVEFADGTIWGREELARLKEQGLIAEGGAGDDLLRGVNNYRNTLLGQAGNDTLDGGNSADTLMGGEGDDRITGFEGNDTLMGGRGNDVLSGREGTDTYLFNLGDGQDRVIGAAWSSVASADVLRFGPGISMTDIQLGRDGDDLLLHHVNGQDGVVVAEWFRFTERPLAAVEFADGQIWTAADLSAQTRYLGYDGAAGNDLLKGTSTSNDTLRGFGGDDELHGLYGKDTLYGGDGADALMGEEGADTLYGEAGDDTLQGGIEADQLYGGDGADILQGGSGQDVYHGGAGNDLFQEGNDGYGPLENSDTYLFGLGDGTDTIQESAWAYRGSEGTDVLRFAAGIAPEDLTLQRVGTGLEIRHANGQDKIIVADWYTPEVTAWSWEQQHSYAPYQGPARIERMEFANGVVWGAGQITRWGLRQEGSQGDDTLTALAGYADTLRGLAGNDILKGGDGADTLEGGAGDDQIEGGAGDNIIVFNLGDGRDTVITPQSSYPAYSNALVFGPGIDPGDITVIRRDGGWEFHHANGEDRITFTHTAPVSVRFQPSPITGAAGMEWTAESLAHLGRHQAGSAAADTLTGSALVDHLDGEGGNDTLNAGEGDDILAGGPGNDTLRGGLGADVYLFNLGDGADTLLEAREDTLRFGPGIRPEDITLQRNGLNLELVHINGADKVIVRDWFGEWINNGSPMGRIEFTPAIPGSEAVAWTGAEVAARVLAQPVAGSSGNDAISGSYGDERFEPGTGNDQVNGQGGSDTSVFRLGDGVDRLTNVERLEFGPGIRPEAVSIVRQGGSVELRLNNGADKVNLGAISTGAALPDVFFTAEEGGDTVIWRGADILATARQQPNLGTEGNDTLFSVSGFLDTVQGLGGNDTLYANEPNARLEGGIGDDRLYSGGGQNAVLAGGAGNDILEDQFGYDTTYVFNPGDGVDTIRERSASSRTDILEFGAGITPQDVTWNRNGNALEFRIGQGGDAVNVTSWFETGWDGSYTGQLDALRFADGTVWSSLYFSGIPDLNLSGTPGNDSLQGGAGDDTLSGLGGNDALDGSAGADHLEGGDGDDVLSGGSGNDVLEGGKGADTLDGDSETDTCVFRQGDGADTVRWADGDILRFGEGIHTADVHFGRQGNSLLISLSSGTDSILADGYTWFDRIEFADGTVWSGAQVQAKLLSVHGTPGDDLLSPADFGFRGFLYGYEGNDTLNGGWQSDVLAGGTGDDQLAGNWGRDRYLYNLGDGMDTISDFGGEGDRLEFGGGIQPGDVSVLASGNDLVLNLSNGRGGITITGFLAPETDYYGYPIGEVAFEGGAVWSSYDLANFARNFQGTSASDILTGTAGNDTLTGGPGQDYLVGGDGYDTYVFNRGDGIDYIGETPNYRWNAWEPSTIRFGDGIRLEDITIVASDFGYGFLLPNGTDQVWIDNSDFYWGGGRPDVGLSFADGSWIGSDQIAGLALQTHIGSDGNDVLTGSTASNELFQAGHGDDEIHGGVGRDTYEFNLGDGHDTLYEQGADATVDVLRLGAGIRPEDVTLTAHGNDLEIRIGNGADQITVRDWYAWDDGYTQLDRFEFTDGTIWENGRFTTAGQTRTGTNGADLLTGSDGYAEILQGGAGDDTLHGGGGDDQLEGGTGNDTLYAGNGADLLAGGAGDDDLHGSYGNDTYLFNLGDGIDTLHELAGDSYTDTLRFGPGIRPGDLHIHRVGDHLELAHSNGQDKVIVRDWFKGEAAQLDSIQFADGASWTARAVSSTALNRPPRLAAAPLAPIRAALGADTLLWKMPADLFTDDDPGDRLSYRLTLADGAPLPEGLRFDAERGELHATPASRTGPYALRLTATDTGGSHASADLDLTLQNLVRIAPQTPEAQGSDGDDHFQWADNTHSHRLTGGAGRDEVQGTDGDDTLRLTTYTGNNTVERIDGGAGVNRLMVGGWQAKLDFSQTELVNIARIEGGKGSDTLIGSQGDDVIVGGAGPDVLDGQGGNDIFLINGDEGIDRIAGGDGFDEIRGGDGDDVIRLLRHADADTVERIDGGAGHNRIVSGAWAGKLDFSATELVNIERIEGYKGADLITGSAGNDVIAGGQGNDLLAGGAGNDTYEFRRGDGADVIQENDATPGKQDTLKLLDINYFDLWYGRKGMDLEMKAFGSSDSVRVKDWFAGGEHKVDRIEMANAALIAQQVDLLIQDMASYAPPPMHETSLPAQYRPIYE